MVGKTALLDATEDDLPPALTIEKFRNNLAQLCEVLGAREVHYCVVALLSKSGDFRMARSGNEIVITWMENGVFKRIVATSEAAALSAAARGEPDKRCAVCREVKALTAFPKDATRIDGHCPRCKRCESVRQEKYRK